VSLSVRNFLTWLDEQQNYYEVHESVYGSKKIKPTRREAQWRLVFTETVRHSLFFGASVSEPAAR